MCYYTKAMRKIILIAHNLRSCHNIGSLLRTAEGLGVEKVMLTGYTPFPLLLSDPRLPHEANKIEKQINKTALGAQNLVKWERQDDAHVIIERLSHDGYEICAVEQSSQSVPLPEWRPSAKIALVVGREVEGIEPDVLERCKVHLEIPMFGKKESFNVVQAAAMALYHCRFS